MWLRSVSLLLALGACVPAAPVTPPAAGNLTSCGGTAYTAFIGRPVADLQIAGLPTSARIIRPDTAVTMDYSAQRLNVRLDGQDRVVALTCG